LLLRRKLLNQGFLVAKSSLCKFSDPHHDLVNATECLCHKCCYTMTWLTLQNVCVTNVATPWPGWCYRMSVLQLTMTWLTLQNVCVTTHYDLVNDTDCLGSQLTMTWLTLQNVCVTTHHDLVNVTECLCHNRPWPG
jgi:hypothetical protein